MRSRALCCMLVALALVLPAVPAAAIAAPLVRQTSAAAEMRELVRERTARGGGEPGFHPSFELQARDGYLVVVAGEGDNVIVSVLRGRHAGSVTSYVARGTVTGNRLAASFGGFGEVSMRFKESTHRTWIKPSRVCTGSGRFETRLGTFVGEFSFRGEGGYVAVQARRAKGQVGGLAPQCRSDRVKLATHPSQDGLFGPDRPYLLLLWRIGVNSAQLAAVKDQKSSFIASTEEAHGKFAIFRLAQLIASSPKSLKVSNALTSARVSPPAPFSGTGNYRAAPDGTVSWTGTLAVNFPGAPHYPLTGPPFEASIGMTSDPFFPFF